ncbi:tumor necrosis factor receptor superfamily member 1B isoform X1 [Polypterus senegalus]|uniref:tumor necrosis factor receptor superfamily member 1B isoform X1 n=1 Tax=Polypterus senegalus TaxID=55291 RepID=UPI0019642389|nr:tumor necrosis factor receptor superfamily member 1B isoform X1 [Polypterus senegalus]
MEPRSTFRTALFVCIVGGVLSSEQISPDPGAEIKYYKVGSSTCLQCPEGFYSDSRCSKDVKECKPCEKEYYWTTKQDRPICNRCTLPCNGNLVEVNDCTKKQNRVCQCKPGMYCKNPTQFSCRTCIAHSPCQKDWGVEEPGNASFDTKCKQCPTGTFSDTVSLTEKCQRYKVTTVKPSSTYQTDSPAKQATHAKDQPHTLVTERINQTEFPATSPHPTLQLFLSSTTPGSDVPVITETTTTQVPPLGEVHIISFLAVMLLIILLLLMLPHVRQRLKKFLKGLCGVKSFPKNGGVLDSGHNKNHYHMQLLKKNNSNPKIERSLYTDAATVSCEHDRPEVLSPENRVQQFVVEPKGGDNVNNNIGSIFILHPSTVILGSVSESGKKGKHEERQRGNVEKIEENRLCKKEPFISVPQQESMQYPSNETISVEDVICSKSCVEEVGNKELQYPVPATGK